MESHRSHICEYDGYRTGTQSESWIPSFSLHAGRLLGSHEGLTVTQQEPVLFEPYCNPIGVPLVFLWYPKGAVGTRWRSFAVDGNKNRTRASAGSMYARAARGMGIRRTAPLSDFQPLCCVCLRSTQGILFIGCPLFIHAAEGRTAYMTCEGAGAPGGSDLGSPWRLRWQPGWMPRRLRCLLPNWLLGWTPHTSAERSGAQMPQRHMQSA